MTAKILAGATAALLYGAAALAEDCPPKQDSQAQRSPPQADDTSGVIILEAPPQDEAVGGGGEVGTEAPGQQGEQPLQGEPSEQGQVLLRCTPVPASATGGSGIAKEKEEKKDDARGVSVLLGGGIEGYTNALAPQLNPGPAASVTAALNPTNVLALELGYTGSALNIDTGVAGGARSGPDIIRHGGQAVATVGLTASSVQPYVLGGIGVSRYNVRAGFNEGFDDDTVGTVPVGAGVRTHFGAFTADARLNYNFLFDQEFAANVPATDVGAPGEGDFSEGGSYLGTVNVGVMF